MKKYFCDVCGAPMADCRDKMPDPGGPAAELCHLEDLCPRCDVLIREMDVAGLIMAELRRLTAPEPEVPTGLRGKGSKEKQAILAALEVYRKEKVGALSALAKRARVSEDELWSMLRREMVPLKTWRAVGRALEVDYEEEKTE